MNFSYGRGVVLVFVATLMAFAPLQSSAATALAVQTPLEPAKFLTPDVAPQGSDVMLSITITNSNPSGPFATDIAFTDVLPAGMVVTSNPNTIFTNTCGGTFTATPGASSIQLSGGQLIAPGICVVRTFVTLVGAGVMVNTVPAGAVTSSNGPSTLPASASVESIVTPTITKAFNPSTIGTGGTSTLTITLGNPNGTLAVASFTDTLPSGVTIATAPNVGNTCGGTLTAAAGTGTVRLQGGTIPPNGTCAVSVAVTANAAGSYTNTIPSGALTTSLPSTPTAPASATLNVINSPAVTKSFTPSANYATLPSTLTVTLTNSNASAAITGVAFTDNYPAGLVNTTTPNAQTTCGGSVTATPGSGSLSLSGGSIPANGSCTVSVAVTATSAGSFQNTIPAGAVTSAIAGSNATSTAATLTARPATDIPTLDPYLLMALAAVLAIAGIAAHRR